MYAAEQPADAVFYHGTRADLPIGGQISPGFRSNFGAGKPASWIYFAATLEAAIWGAELAQGEGRQRIYVVRPTGTFVDDPNLTDKKFPGNITQSYRSQAPLEIVGEVETWTGHPPEQLERMREGVERARKAGIEAID
ncbi:rifampin ADP-ribosylating transferase [Devosia lucknowensis]|uniref:Rifampin ADP-ribosylating transferase n=1 Tax=Devosia lucknowensis TaxID=1096929 RepID=A0A1Y6EVS7_9HYPH|nr:NAD(+)--rifampin ADP-ribosyltransferase [Devosia lucknowensis]SMQ64602.1 rifampin ADP-ribosylating transferase [Devosia lucknowensis]